MSNFIEKVKNKEKWISNPFFAFEGGYRVNLEVYAAGYGDGEGTHISVFLRLMKGPYDDELEQSGHFPLRGTFTMELINQLNDKNHYSLNVVATNSTTDPCRNAYQRFTNGLQKSTSCGYHTFMQHQKLRESISSDISYITNETVYFGVRYYDGHSSQRISYSKEVSRMTKQLSKQHVSLQESVWSQIIMLSSKISSYGDEVVPVVLKMANFSEKMKNKEEWNSEPFFAFEGGYKMCVKVYLSGYGDGEGTHISAFLYLKKGPYDDFLEQSGHFPLKGTFTMELLNQLNDDDHRTYNVIFDDNTYTRVVEGDMSPSGRGRHKFISHDDMFNSKYLMSDNVYFRVMDNSKV